MQLRKKWKGLSGSYDYNKNAGKQNAGITINSEIAKLRKILHKVHKENFLCDRSKDFVTVVVKESYALRNSLTIQIQNPKSKIFRYFAFSLLRHLIVAASKKI
jgi:hypothetical protein